MGKKTLAQDATTSAIVVSRTQQGLGSYLKVTMKATDIALRPPLVAEAGSVTLRAGSGLGVTAGSLQVRTVGAIRLSDGSVGIGLAAAGPLRDAGGSVVLRVGGGIGVANGTVQVRLAPPLLLSSGTIGIGTVPANKVPVSLMLNSSGGTVVLTIQAPLRQDGNFIGIGTVPDNRLGAGVADSTKFLKGDRTWAGLLTRINSLRSIETETTVTTFTDVEVFSLSVPDGAVLTSCLIKFEFRSSSGAKAAYARISLTNGESTQTSVQFSTTSTAYVAKIHTDATDIGGLEKLAGQSFLLKLQVQATSGASAFTRNWNIRTVFVG